MRRRFIRVISVLLLGVLLGCETVNGVTKDIANTARNIRDILGVGRDIGNIAR